MQNQSKRHALSSAAACGRGQHCSAGYVSNRWLCRPRTCHSRVSTALAAATELRICVNRTCKRQGSQQISKFLKELSVGHDISVVETGCLGECGNGPNMVLLPDERLLAHVATPADAAEVLTAYCDVDVPDLLLKATQLRLAGNAAAMSGQLQEAVQHYTQALELNAPRSQHMLYSNRSAALLQLGRQQEALQDAQLAVQHAPPDFTMAWVRVIDSHYALKQYAAAAEAANQALQQCSTFKSCAEFPAIAQALAKVGHPLKGQVAQPAAQRRWR